MAEQVWCSNCGKYVPDDGSGLCPECGIEIRPDENPAGDDLV